MASAALSKICIELENDRVSGRNTVVINYFWLLNYILKLSNNLSSENKENHNCEGGLDTSLS